MVSVSPLTSYLILAAGHTRRLLVIVILHDNEPRRSYRTVEANAGNAREIARATRSRRDRQVRRAPLPGSPAIPARLRATEQGQQVDRARGSLKLSDRAELGIQR